MDNNTDNNGQNQAIQDNSNQEAENRLKNLQAEMTRKTQNLDDKLNQINESLRQMSLMGNQVQVPQNQNNDQRPDPILDAEGYERYIEQKLENKMNEKIGAQQRQQAEIATLVNMFPELSDATSDFSKAAIQAYNNLSPQEKAIPGAYKLAVQGAALEMGLLPKNKRQSNNKQQNEVDDIGNMSNGRNNNQSQQSKQGKVKLDDATIAFAQMLGKDVNDPKYVERLQKAASRTRWSKAQNRNDY